MNKIKEFHWNIILLIFYLIIFIFILLYLVFGIPYSYFKWILDVKDKKGFWKYHWVRVKNVFGDF